MVPAEVVISSGVAQTSTSLNPTLSWASHFVKSLQAQFGVFSWTSTWNITPVSDGSDLQNLRAIYGFVTNPLILQVSEVSKLSALGSNPEAIRIAKINAATQFLAAQAYGSEASGKAAQAPSAPPPIPSVPDPKTAAAALVAGQSSDCQAYQAQKGPNQIYNQWLFWRQIDGWHPYKPNEKDSQILIGNVENAQIYVTNQACFDDFIVLVQSPIPVTHAAAASSPKPSGVVPAPAL
jgi:hypothetical protein